MLPGIWCASCQASLLVLCSWDIHVQYTHRIPATVELLDILWQKMWWKCVYFWLFALWQMLDTVTAYHLCWAFLQGWISGQIGRNVFRDPMSLPFSWANPAIQIEMSSITNRHQTSVQILRVWRLGHVMTTPMDSPWRLSENEDTKISWIIWKLFDGFRYFRIKKAILLAIYWVFKPPCWGKPR